MIDRIRSFAADESGVTLVEYGLIFALLAVGAIAAMFLLSTNTNTSFADSQNQFQSYGTRVPDQ